MCYTIEKWFTDSPTLISQEQKEVITSTDEYVLINGGQEVIHTPTMPSCLNILYYNARSIIPKMDELRALVDLQQPHIVSIVESWLSGEISDNEIHLQGYQVLRLDRNRHGGGLLVFVHESLVPKVIMAGPSNLELLIFSVTNHTNTCKHHVGLLSSTLKWR